MPQKYGKFFAFTFYPGPEESDEVYGNLLQEINHLVFAVFQREVCPKTGREHLQGCCGFRKSISRNLGRRKLQVALPGAHICICRKDIQFNIKYCSRVDKRKDGHEAIYIGTIPALGGGARTDLMEVRKRIRSGTSIADIADDFFPTWVRNHRAFEKYAGMCQKSADRQISVTLLVGPPGTGKSRFCSEFVEQDSIFWFSSATAGTYFDGYENERILVLDDFTGGFIPRFQLLRVLDRYPYNLPCRGYSRAARYETVYITSNSWPQKWYRDETRVWNICRRINRLGIFSDDGVISWLSGDDIDTMTKWNSLYFSSDCYLK